LVEALGALAKPFVFEVGVVGDGATGAGLHA
jgi:hypothetical protein